MASYLDLIKFLKSDLSNVEFQSFLNGIFDDLTEYSIVESDYIQSKKYGVEIGFRNPDAIYDEDDKTVFHNGNPVFSHFNLFPLSEKIFDKLPFGVNFNDKRTSVIQKAGPPFQTNKGILPILGKYLTDIYRLNDWVVRFDYQDDEETISFIQITSKEQI